VHLKTDFDSQKARLRPCSTWKCRWIVPREYNTVERAPRLGSSIILRPGNPGVRARSARDRISRHASLSPVEHTGFPLYIEAEMRLPADFLLADANRTAADRRVAAQQHVVNSYPATRAPCPPADQSHSVQGVDFADANRRATSWIRARNTSRPPGTPGQSSSPPATVAATGIRPEPSAADSCRSSLRARSCPARCPRRASSANKGRPSRPRAPCCSSCAAHSRASLQTNHVALIGTKARRNRFSSSDAELFGKLFVFLRVLHVNFQNTRCARRLRSSRRSCAVNGSFARSWPDPRKSRVFTCTPPSYPRQTVAWRDVFAQAREKIIQLVTPCAQTVSFSSVRSTLIIEPPSSRLR